jgi:hypothetical protein
MAGRYAREGLTVRWDTIVLRVDSVDKVKRNVFAFVFTGFFITFNKLFLCNRYKFLSAMYNN